MAKTDETKITNELSKRFAHEPFISFGEYHVYPSDIFVAILIGFISWLLVRWIKRLLTAAHRSNKLTVGQMYAYSQLSKYFIFVISIVLILQSLRVNISILLAGSAALLVGIGLGLQQLFNDFASGFFLLFEGSVRVDDIIEVDGMVCKVEEIGIRTSKVRNRDGISVVIPNSKIVSNSVINWSTESQITRFKVDIGVSYESDIRQVREVLLSCAAMHQEVVKNPKPVCRFVDFGESSLNFELLFWSKHRFRIEDVKSDLRFLIFSELSKKNIQIPFPQRDLHIKSDVRKSPPNTDSEIKS